MRRPRIREIVRQFPENGLKLLLHDSANVNDVLHLANFEWVDELDLTRMTVDPTTYVASDYRHVASDLVLQIPFRPVRGRSPRRLILYVLIEHQSEPDRLMLFRVMDYLIQIWKGQIREKSQQSVTDPDFRLQPILPVVLYTGTRPWPGLGGLAELIEFGERFETITPLPRPLFVNLPALTSSQLTTAGGYLGCVLQLVQQRRARPEEFARLVQHAVGQLETMARTERLRWLELWSYIHALVYHVREESEQPELRQIITDSMRTDPNRQEVIVMGRTIAEALRAEGEHRGEVKALQRALLRQMRNRFAGVPKPVEKSVRNTKDPARLETWLDLLWTAKSLDDLGIPANE